MFDGYLKYRGTEVLNAARTIAYIAARMPKIDVLCDMGDMDVALGKPAGYTNPEADGAPWYSSDRAATGRFYGFLPGGAQGSEDSTRTVETTSLTGDGAVLTSPRHAEREIRFKVTAFADDEEAMEEGMAWLRDRLGDAGCSNADLVCPGHEMAMFAARPETTGQAANLLRTYYRTEITEGPLVVAKLPSKAGVLWEIEFTSTSGVPWAFTPVLTAGTATMDTAVSYTDPAWEDCTIGIDPYEDLVIDPYFTAVSAPPKAPVIQPPNLLDISTWRRHTINIPETQSSRWGRVAPVVRISTEGAVQFLRIRFYQVAAGVSGCDFDAEFLISYIPASATMTLNAITRETTLEFADGRSIPAGNLVYGSGGRPPLWPSLGCRRSYVMTADLMPNQLGAVVILDTAVRG